MESARSRPSLSQSRVRPQPACLGMRGYRPLGSHHRQILVVAAGSASALEFRTKGLAYASLGSSCQGKRCFLVTQLHASQVCSQREHPDQVPAAGEYLPTVPAEPAPAPAAGGDWEAAPAPVADSQGGSSHLGQPAKPAAIRPPECCGRPHDLFMTAAPHTKHMSS